MFDSYTLSMSYQSGSVPVLEEARTMLYVKNHNMITMEMRHFQNIKRFKMAAARGGISEKKYSP